MSGDFLDSDELKVERLEAEIDRLTSERAEIEVSRDMWYARANNLAQERDRLRAKNEQLVRQIAALRGEK